MPTTTHLYDRYEELTNDEPAPLLLLSVVFAMLSVGCLFLGALAAISGGLPAVVALMPAALLALLAIALLAGDFGMRRRR